MEFLVDEGENTKCRKHPSRNANGVCAICLRNRLILLCPDCANVRPCACYHPFDNSSSSSSSASLSSSSFGLPRSASVSGGYGPISFLIDAEPAIQRSRSTAFQFLRPPTSGEKIAPTPGNRRWWLFTSLFRWEKTKKVKEAKKIVKLEKSRSVGVSCYSDHGEVSGREIRLKGRIWQFPSPIKVFRQPRPAKFEQERSPLCRG